MKPILLKDILEPRQNNFTLLRLLAALAVVASHAIFLKSGNKADEVFAGSSVYVLGDHAVNVFFVLSGLTVAASLDRSNDVVRFLIARMLRIFPALIVCTVALVIFGVVISDCSVLEYLTDTRVITYALKTMSLSTASAELPGVFASNPYPSVVNASLWTLKFEVVCYLLLALLGAAGLLEKRKVSLLLPAVGIVASAFLLYRSGGYADSLEQLARFWLCFSFGVGLFVFRDHVRISIVTALLLAALTWLVLGAGAERVVSPIATGYAALLLGCIPIGRLREFTNRNDISYGVYIFGWPTSQSLIHAYPTITVGALIVLSAVIASALAYLSWHWIERPSLRTRDGLVRWCRAFVAFCVTDTPRRPAENRNAAADTKGTPGKVGDLPG
ncbi:MAG: acyltransferase [Xanthobacteraceae bacterium]|nr:acyltransferase [Xanthobacteraceae bacterium]